jgi:hypothetical protein
MGKARDRVQEHNLEIENSWPGKWLRRWQFYVRYCRARARWSTLRRLEPILEKHFKSHQVIGKNPWISHVAVRLRLLPGFEDREFLIRWWGDRFLLRLRFFPWREEGCQAVWSSPVTILVFKKGKDGGKSVPVRYMSLFVEDDMIRVAHMQGVSKIEMPPGLKDWAERMLRACVEFAQEENFRGVSVASAQSQYSFHHPYVHPWYTAEERVRETNRIRERMKTHHDGAGRALGWSLEGAWFKWNNPNYRVGVGDLDASPIRHRSNCRHAGIPHSDHVAYRVKD